MERKQLIARKIKILGIEKSVPFFGKLMKKRI